MESREADFRVVSSQEMRGCLLCPRRGECKNWSIHTTLRQNAYDPIFAVTTKYMIEVLVFSFWTAVSGHPFKLRKYQLYALFSAISSISVSSEDLSLFQPTRLKNQVRNVLPFPRDMTERGGRMVQIIAKSKTRWGRTHPLSCHINLHGSSILEPG